jgi:hypothetical protein
MYRCEICKQVVPPRTKAYRIPVKTRLRHYPYRKEAIPIIDEKGKRKLIDDPGGVGYEIVEEVLACPACAGRMDDSSG